MKFSAPNNVPGGGGGIAGANNGASVSSIDPTKIVLGQDVGQGGSPGQLITNREVPFNGKFLEFTGAGSMYLNVPTPSSAGTIVFFGDSITVGQNATNAAHRYSSITATGLGMTESNLGLSGSTLMFRVITDPFGVASMIERIPLIPVKTAALKWLVFLYGINDIQWNGPNYTTANFQTDYQTVITAAIAAGWPANRIVLLSTLYTDPTTFISQGGNPIADNARQVAFNSVISTLASTNGCLFYDAYTDIFNNGAGRLMSTPAPNIHPSNAGMQIVAMGLIQLLANVTQNGQKLAVNGLVELNTLRLDAFGNAPSIALPLAVDNTGNVGIASTLNCNDLVAFLKGAFNGAAVTDVSESVISNGGYKGTSLRLNGPLQGIENIGNSIELAFLVSPAVGTIAAFNRGTGTGMPLALNGYGGGRVNIGALNPAASQANLTITNLTESLGSLRVSGPTTFSGATGFGVEISYHTGVGTTWGGIQVLDRTGGPLLLNLSLNPGGAPGNVMVGKDGTAVNDNGATFQVAGDMTTADPGLGIGKWKMGKRQAAAVVFDATQYIQVMVDGVAFKLGIVN